MDRPQFAEDKRFQNKAARVEHRAVLADMLQSLFKTQLTHQWIEALLDAGVPCGPVNDVPAALGSAQSVARNMVKSVTGAHGGEVRMVGPAPKMSATAPSIRTPPPALGQHTAQVLREMLGYDEERLQSLRAAGAID